MKTNTSVKGSMATVTHEGGQGVNLPASQELLKAMATCMLWENTFYESGNDIAARIATLAKKASLADVVQIARYTKDQMKLRHAPLFLMVQALNHPEKGLNPKLVGQGICDVIRRPDEMGEMLSIYWKGKKRPIPAQMKKGFAAAFTKFDEYQLAKWDKEAAIRIKDVLFLCHAKPVNEAQDQLWKRLIAGTMAVPQTWEVLLSAGGNNKEAWEWLLVNKKLPYMALLMNLRNMVKAGVDRKLVVDALMKGAERSRALPFRFIGAGNAAPEFAAELGEAMVKAIKGELPGKTAFIVDVSGSMDYHLSGKSQLNRIDAAGALGILLREVCEYAEIYTFSENLVQVPNYRGLALRDAIVRSQPHGGTFLKAALERLYSKSKGGFDRVIVITDEQSHDGIAKPWTKGAYVINVAPYKPGLSSEGGWVRVNGWSERVADFICFEEYGKVMMECEEEEE